jgi:hypothetical protein
MESVLLVTPIVYLVMGQNKINVLLVLMEISSMQIKVNVISIALKDFMPISQIISVKYVLLLVELVLLQLNHVLLVFQDFSIKKVLKLV